MAVVKMTLGDYCRDFPSRHPERKELFGAFCDQGAGTDGADRIQKFVDEYRGLTPYAHSSLTTVFNFFREAAKNIEITVDTDTAEVLSSVSVIEPFGGGNYLPFLALLSVVTEGRRALEKFTHINLDCHPSLLVNLAHDFEPRETPAMDLLRKILEDKAIDLTCKESVDALELQPNLIVMHNPFVPRQEFLLPLTEAQLAHHIRLQKLGTDFYPRTLPRLCAGRKVQWAVKSNSLGESNELIIAMQSYPGCEAFRDARQILIQEEEGWKTSLLSVCTLVPPPSVPGLMDLRALREKRSDYSVCAGRQPSAS